LEDLTEQSNEIQEIMGRSYGMPEIDDDELEAELEALGDEIALDDDASYLDEASKAPNAPTAVPGADSITNKVIVVISFIIFVYRVKCRHRIYGYDTIAVLHVYNLA